MFPLSNWDHRCTPTLERKLRLREGGKCDYGHTALGTELGLVTQCRFPAPWYLPAGPRGVILGTEGFLDRGARPPLSLGSLRALSGRLARSLPASPLVLAAIAGVDLEVAVLEVGRARGFRVWLRLSFSRACSGGSSSGSTMQMLGGVGSGGGTLRGLGSWL